MPVAPSMAQSVTTPFADGQLVMDDATFKAAREMLARPPGDPASAAAHERIYYAAMVVDHRQRTIDNKRQGITTHDYFICPICRREMDSNFQHKTFECKPCGRGCSPEYLLKQFGAKGTASGIVVPAAGPAKVITTTPSKPKHDPHYKPALTTPLPKHIIPDELDKISEAKAKQDQPVEMYRSWQLPVPVANEPRLYSINKAEWPSREPMTAQHWGGTKNHDDEGCPNWHCQCGIYGVKTLLQAQRWGQSSSDRMQVLGKVSMWGRVLVFETGAKAQFAYPTKLWLSPTRLASKGMLGQEERIASELAAHYGITVELEDGMYDLGLSHT